MMNVGDGCSFYNNSLRRVVTAAAQENTELQFTENRTQVIAELRSQG